MKTEKEIQKRISEIKNDERMKVPPATVDINAPLALIQCNFEGELPVLR